MAAALSYKWLVLVKRGMTETPCWTGHATTSWTGVIVDLSAK
jgi:hypothetical protein